MSFENLQPGTKVMGRPMKTTKGGIIVLLNGEDLEGMEAFLPNSNISQTHLSQEAIDAFVNASVLEEFTVHSIHSETKNIVISKKPLFSKKDGIEVLKEVWQAVQDLNSGRLNEQNATHYIGHHTLKGCNFEVRKTPNGYMMIVKGVIKNIAQFGPFVSLSGFGIDGLLHISDISWSRAITVDDALSKTNVQKASNNRNSSPYIGSEVEVAVLRVTDGDGKDFRVSLGLKQLDKDTSTKYSPADFAKEFRVGDIVEGTVSSVPVFGAFIELKPGFDGLVHISEMSHNRVARSDQLVRQGQKVKVQILSIDLADPKNPRISLSMKKLGPNPMEAFAEKYQVGDIVEGIVKTIPDYGAFVELEPGIEGLIHISEMSHSHVASAKDVVGVGERVKVQILGMDLNSHPPRISLGMKQFENHDDYE